MWFRLPVTSLLLVVLTPPSGSHAQPDVEDLLVVYRLQVYESFRDDRPEYERRCAAAEQLYQQLRDHRSGAAERAVQEWLQQALAVSRPQGTAPLPPLPAIGSGDPAHVDSLPEVRRIPVGLGDGPAPTRQDVTETGTGVWELLRQAQRSDLADSRRALDAEIAAISSVVDPPVTQLTVQDVWTPPTQIDSRVVQIAQAPEGPPGPAASPPNSLLAEVDDTTAETVLADLSPEVLPQGAIPANRPPAVELLELNARIAGYNLALEGLTARLETAGESPDVAVSTWSTLLTRLSSLARADQTIRRLADALPDAQRGDVIPARELQSLTQRVRQVLSTRREAFDGDVADEPWTALIQQLDALATGTE